MSDVSALVRRNVEYADLHVRLLSAARDSETGWPTVTWASECFDPDCFECDCFHCGPQIRVHLESMSERTDDPAAGVTIENRIKVTTYAPINHLDRIIYKGVTYQVENEPHVEYYRGYYMYRTATLVRQS